MKKTFLLSLFALSAMLMGAQVSYQPKADVPFDRDVITGKLPNGLTYYIHPNAQPKDRAELYLVVNAGAILEDPDQNGLAHFCEHMAFNGTENFEKHQIIKYLQSIGMKFGPEINAFTSHDVTAYMLQKVPLTNPGHLDTALMILYEWAGKISFENEEIDNERGVIHEEWRTGRSAMERISKRTDKKLYQNSKYAVHDVIGDIQIIDHFEYDVLKRFYRDWYRPDLQAIIAVGDFDPVMMEEKIHSLFGKLPAHPSPRERYTEPVPDHEETLVAVETDKEAQYTIVQVYYKHKPAEERNMEYLRNRMKVDLFNQMMNARYNELQRQADPPFVYGYNAYSGLVKSKDALVSLAVSKSGEAIRALQAVLTENERVLRHGFTPGELERAKSELLKQRENSYKERNKRKSEQLVWKYFSHYLNNQPVPGVEFEYEFAKGILPGITVEEINLLPAAWLTDRNRVVMVTGPEKEGLVYPAEKEVLSLLSDIESKPVEPYVDKVSDKPLIDKLPAAGKLAVKKEDKATGVHTWELSNGVKVVLKPTDFKEDEVLFSAVSNGGSSLYPLSDYTSAQYAGQVIGESGLGSFGPIELQKALSGKIVSVSPFIRDMQEGFNGSSSRKDLETLLQLVHLNFTQPRADESSYGSFVNRMKGFLENSSLNPANAYRDTIQVTMASYSPFRKPMNVDRLNEINLQAMQRIFSERFSDADGFTFYFVGSIDLPTIQPLIEKYIGSLPAKRKNESWKDLGVRPPQGKVSKTVVRDMEDPKATVYVALTGDFDYSPDARLAMSAINDMLSFRYVETIREEEGGTYGAGVWSQQNKYPRPSYQMNIQFDCDPENAEKLTGIVYREIEKLCEEGPDDKQMNSFRENKLKTWDERMQENRFWLSSLTAADFDGESYSSILEYPAKVKSLTAEQVKEIARKYYRNGNVVEVTLLPADLSKSVRNPNIQK